MVVQQDAHFETMYSFRIFSSQRTAYYVGICNVQPRKCTPAPITMTSFHTSVQRIMLPVLSCLVLNPVNVQVQPLHRLRVDQVTLGEDVATGAYGSIRMVKSIDSPLFPADKQYVAKQLIKEHGRNARRSLATEAVNIGVFHPSFVMALGITSTHPYLLVMEYWPHGNLGLYWYVFFHVDVLNVGLVCIDMSSSISSM